MAGVSHHHGAHERGKKIVLADDHPVFLQGLGELLKGEADLCVVGEASDASQLIELVAHTRPDVAIIDLSMPGDVFQSISDIAREMTETKMLVYTAYCSPDSAIRALEAGSLGFVLKTSPYEELLEAIGEVSEGHMFVAKQYATSVMTSLKVHAKSAAAFEEACLTSREMAIVAHVVHGYTNRQIASQLQLSEKTVKYYMTQIMQKLKARNRVEVAISAKQHEQDLSGQGSIREFLVQT